MSRISKTLNKISLLLGSRRFYTYIVGFFVFESIWIAFSAVYPQAFDENFHFGLIKVYSHYWLPFLSSQPAGANAYGAVAHDPSYLYHYLMSFPYRLIALFFHSQTSQVISLRLVDIGFFVVGLTLFRRVLRRVGLSRSLTNVILLLFVLIPIVPQLAAQVSYDDLLFPLVAWLCLETFKVTDQIRHKQPSFKSLASLTIVALLTCLVKYAFLPILFSIVLFLGVVTYNTYRHQFKSFLVSLKQDFGHQSRLVKFGLSGLLVLSMSLIIQRDGMNLIQYHSIDPDCSKILSLKACSAYSPWQVQYVRHQQLVKGGAYVSYSLLGYTRQWFYWMWYRLFFAVNGAASNFASRNPLPLPSIAAACLAITGGLAMIKWRRRLFRNNPYLTFLLTACIIYVVALFIQGYSTYRYTAVLENMNGRYLIPVLLPIAAIGALAINFALRRSKAPRTLMAVIVIVLFLQGGGILTFILRSDQSWYWPNSTVLKINNTARKVAKKVVFKSG